MVKRSARKGGKLSFAFDGGKSIAVENLSATRVAAALNAYPDAGVVAAVASGGTIATTSDGIVIKPEPLFSKKSVLKPSLFFDCLAVDKTQSFDDALKVGINGIGAEAKAGNRRLGASEFDPARGSNIARLKAHKA